MKAVNYSELRQNLKANLDAVTENEDFLVVHRPKREKYSNDVVSGIQCHAGNHTPK